MYYVDPKLKKALEVIFLSLMGLVYGLIIFLLHGQMLGKIEKRNASGQFYPARLSGERGDFTDLTHSVFSWVVNHPFLSAIIWFLIIIPLVMFIRVEKAKDFMVFIVVIPSVFFILVTIQYYVALMQI